jgi:hypothetical protein
MKILLTCILLSLVSIVTAQTVGHTTDDYFNEKRINQILFEIVSADSTIMDKNCKLVDGFNSDLQSAARRYIDTAYLKTPYFKDEDLDFCLEQVQKNKDFKLTNENLKKGYGIISKKAISKFINTTESDYNAGKPYDFYGRFEKELGKIQEFSLPFISKNGKYVFVRYVKYYAPKKLKGWMRIYERDSNSWRLVRTVREFSK